MRKFIFLSVLLASFSAFSQEVTETSENEIIAVSQKRLSAEMEINVFPNPSNGKFFISAREGSTIEVFNSSGLQIFMGSVLIQPEVLSIEGLSSGVYLCRISEGENVVVKRLVVN